MEDTESCSSTGTESNSTQNRKSRLKKTEIYQEVLQRMKDFKREELSEPGFEDELWNHFNRLPMRYTLLPYPFYILLFCRKLIIIIILFIKERIILYLILYLAGKIKEKETRTEILLILVFYLFEFGILRIPLTKEMKLQCNLIPVV